MSNNRLATVTEKAQNLLNRLGQKDQDDEVSLRKRLDTFKVLSEARRQVVSANHNLKIVLERMAKDSSSRAGLLNDEQEKIIGDTLLFLRNTHNLIAKLGQQHNYNFRYRGPKKDEIKRHRVKNQLEKLISSRKLMSQS